MEDVGVIVSLPVGTRVTARAGTYQIVGVIVGGYGGRFWRSAPGELVDLSDQISVRPDGDERGHQISADLWQVEVVAPEPSAAESAQSGEP